MTPQDSTLDSWEVIAPSYMLSREESKLFQRGKWYTREKVIHLLQKSEGSFSLTERIYFIYFSGH